MPLSDKSKLLRVGARAFHIVQKLDVAHLWNVDFDVWRNEDEQFQSVFTGANVALMNANVFCPTATQIVPPLWRSA